MVNDTYRGAVILLGFYPLHLLADHSILLHATPLGAIMMTSSNGNNFRVTGPLPGESIGDRWIPLTTASDAELWCFLWSAHEQTVKQTIETPSRSLWRHCNVRLYAGEILCIWQLHLEHQNLKTVDIKSWMMANTLHQQNGKVFHYNDVIMGAIASQITSPAIVYSNVYWGDDQRKHQSSASLAFVRGIHRGPVNSPLHRGPVNSPHKWPVTRKMFPFDDVRMSWWTIAPEIPVSQTKSKVIQLIY